MSRERKLWARDELLVAINLYCTIPFGKIHDRNPEIIELSKRLGRTPGALSYKLANFAAIDPTLDRKGASNVSKLDRSVWEEFFADWEPMLVESERLRAELLGTQVDLQPLTQADDIGRERVAETRVRVNQHLFRRMILSSYGNRCCITGIAHSELLVASHISPWAEDKANRLNPMNGLCLNALHDRAFERGLIGIDESYRVMVSKRVSHELLRRFAGQRIELPSRFLPSQELLEDHRHTFF